MTVHALAEETLFPPESEIPSHLRIDPPIHQNYSLSSGTLVPWPGPLTPVESPIRLLRGSDLVPKMLGFSPRLSTEASREAFEAARRAYDAGSGHWPMLGLEGRCEVLEQFADRMQAVRDEVVRLLMWEIAKPFEEAEDEFDRTLGYIHDTVDAVREGMARNLSLFHQEGFVARCGRAPLGVVLSMGPYNYPLNETFATLIPALLMGNTLVMKPPRLGVLLNQPLLPAFRDLFPPGVVNIIYGHGEEIIPPIIQSGELNGLAFVGSAGVGAELLRSHPHPNRLTAILGLEAKNAAIVLPDADLEVAAEEITRGAFTYNGQRCTAIKIVFVHRRIAERFLNLLAEAADRLVVGPPWAPDVQITPMAEVSRAEYLAEAIHEARELGADIVNHNGGHVRENYVYPTIIYPASPDARLYREEQFGPVLPVIPFVHRETPLKYLQSGRYGLQASLFGTDPDSLAEMIQPMLGLVGRVNLNSQCQRGPDVLPFSARKDSGLGTLSVTEALQAFSLPVTVAGRATEINHALFHAMTNGGSAPFFSSAFPP